MTGKEDGEAVDVADVEAALEPHGHTLAAARHRAGAHGPRRVLRQLDYIARGPGVTADGDALAVRARRARDGHRRLGLGRAAPPPGARRRVAPDEPGIFWAAHQADLPYSQIERLVNLGALPPTGFQVAASR